MAMKSDARVRFISEDIRAALAGVTSAAVSAWAEFPESGRVQRDVPLRLKREIDLGVMCSQVKPIRNHFRAKTPAAGTRDYPPDLGVTWGSGAAGACPPPHCAPHVLH
ncbi:hypothetical protein E2C01_054509 [Portunus trituberculatus]|uniref:Uncharacterized protein n=1 Tax=Portunus trituberculatus TaxID=210409 RepID=A0A5B7GV80_PORTR|nr:hypothetical protein [Portunus trituberculatus]